MKRRASKRILSPNINLPCATPPEDWDSIFPGPMDFDMPIALWDQVVVAGPRACIESIEILNTCFNVTKKTRPDIPFPGSVSQSSFLPELPLDLDRPRTFLDQVGVFVTSRPMRR